MAAPALAAAAPIGGCDGGQFACLARILHDFFMSHLSCRMPGIAGALSGTAVRQGYQFLLQVETEGCTTAPAIDKMLQFLTRGNRGLGADAGDGHRGRILRLAGGHFQRQAARQGDGECADESVAGGSGIDR
jgi:hypothetical protein